MIIRHHRENQHPLSGYIEASGDVFLENHGDPDHGSLSDCESGVSGSKMPLTELFSGGGGGDGGFGLIAVGEEERLHIVIKRRFLSCLGSGIEADVAVVHRRRWSAAPAQANLMAFQIYLRVLAQKNSGNANVRYAWFGTSKAGVEKIFAHGFSHEEINRSPGTVHGRGVHHLSPDCSPLQRKRESQETSL